ncbi:class I adenylate-forming enzyme family protein [Halorientalis halophila]|uniref:class I adenylate-forming enzyme family protein n=1 Tax=Halorientalis halophila TaxID=3108499 RepID=UPI0030088FB6
MDFDDLGAEPLTGNAAGLHDRTAAVNGEHLAIEADGEELTHAELNDRAARFAGGLHDFGLAPDDRIVLYLPNCPAYVIAALGGLKAGTPVSFMNPQYKPREMVYQLEDTDAEAIITHWWLRSTVDDALAETDLDPVVITAGDREQVPEEDHHVDDVAGEPTHVERDAEDVALQPYTSGTTGRPKGVLLTHRNLRAQGLDMLREDDEKAPVTPAELKSLIWLPMYHITGFVHCGWQPLLFGGSLHLRSAMRWDPTDAMATIEEFGITQFVGVTTMYVDVVEDDAFGEYDLSSLEVAAEGGAKMSVAVQREFEETAGVKITEGYGLTETAGATHTEVETAFGHREGTVGQPLQMTDSKIVDESGEEVPPGEEGELLVRGPQVMTGYHDMPEATAESFTERGYFRTGDVARRDRDNYYEIVDRKTDIVVTAGYNVYPSEVEELLGEHDAVSEAAVVGVDDDRRNEVPVAYVVPHRDVEPGIDVTEDEIQAFALTELAEYKHPREVTFVDDLPRTTSGKIQKYKLGPDE